MLSDRQKIPINISDILKGHLKGDKLKQEENALIQTKNLFNKTTRDQKLPKISEKQLLITNEDMIDQKVLLKLQKKEIQNFSKKVKVPVKILNFEEIKDHQYVKQFDVLIEKLVQNVINIQDILKNENFVQFGFQKNNVENQYSQLIQAFRDQIKSLESQIMYDEGNKFYLMSRIQAIQIHFRQNKTLIQNLREDKNFMNENFEQIKQLFHKDNDEHQEQDTKNEKIIFQIIEMMRNKNSETIEKFSQLNIFKKQNNTITLKTNYDEQKEKKQLINNNKFQIYAQKFKNLSIIRSYNLILNKYVIEHDIQIKNKIRIIKQIQQIWNDLELNLLSLGFVNKLLCLSKTMADLKLQGIYAKKNHLPQFIDDSTTHKLIMEKSDKYLQLMTKKQILQILSDQYRFNQKIMGQRNNSQYDNQKNFMKFSIFQNVFKKQNQFDTQESYQSEILRNTAMMVNFPKFKPQVSQEIKNKQKFEKLMRSLNQKSEQKYQNQKNSDQENYQNLHIPQLLFFENNQQIDLQYAQKQSFLIQLKNYNTNIEQIQNEINQIDDKLTDRIIQLYTSNANDKNKTNFKSMMTNLMGIQVAKQQILKRPYI